MINFNEEPKIKAQCFINKIKSLQLEEKIKEIKKERSLISYENYFRINSPDLQFLRIMEDILLNGDHKKSGRTEETTISTFGQRMRFNLNEYFPLLTSKKVFIRGVFEELMWMLRGQVDVKILQDKKVFIWDGNMLEDGTIGKGYGYQWRNGMIDQIEELRNSLKNNPDSRRHIVSAWNFNELSEMALPPCHALFQFYISGDNKLSCQLYQRSADMFLGVPFNIVFYSMLTHLLAAELGIGVGEFIWVGGDCHIYDNHIEQALEQLSRTPLDSPSFSIVNPKKSIYDYEFKDIQINGYYSHETIKGSMAV